MVIGTRCRYETPYRGIASPLCFTAVTSDPCDLSPLAQLFRLTIDPPAEGSLHIVVVLKNFPPLETYADLVLVYVIL